MMSENKQQATVEVAGGYKPETITLHQGIPAELSFTRTNDQGCLDVVHSKTLNFEEELPLNETKTVTIDTSKTGEFDFSCGMDMFHGKVVIEP